MRTFLSILVILCALGLNSNAQSPKPDDAPTTVIGTVVEIVKPDLYKVTITLSSGEVLTMDKVAFTKRSLEKKLVLRVLDHTIRIIPDAKEGEEAKVRVIKSSEIERIDIVKIKPEPPK